MESEKKIEIFYEVLAIKKYFQKQLLETLSTKVYKIKIMDEKRSATSYLAEDAGFERAKQLALEILDKECQKLL